MLPRLRGLRCAFTGALALAGVATTIICSSQTVVSYTSPIISLTDTDWTSGTTGYPALTVPQFNSALGTLTSVTVVFNWSTYQSLSIANTSTSATSDMVYGISQASVTLSMPSLADFTAISGISPTLTLGSETPARGGSGYTATGALAAGATLYGTTSGGSSTEQGPTTTGPGTAAATSPTGNTSSETFSSSTDLAAFNYTGSATYNSSTDIATFVAATTSSSYTMVGNGNDVGNVTTQAGASVTVFYTYTPPINTNTTPPGCVQGAVINNVSGDGHCNHPTETGLGEGITVNVYTTTGTLVGTTTTAADGSYEVTGLLPNTTYIVMVVVSSLPSGYTLSCQNNCLSVNVPATGCATGVSFTAVQCNKGCQYNTFCQSDWSCTENCNNYNSCLKNCYCIVYPEGNCTIGGCNASWCLTSCSAIENCLVHGGNNCPLPHGCQTNPRSYCNQGQLCGETLACKLNCDFSDAGIFCSGFKNLTCQSGQFKGCTVGQVLNAANCYLNGQTSLPNVPRCSGNDLCNCLQQINQCFSSSCGNGGGSGFCQ